FFIIFIIILIVSGSVLAFFVFSYDKTVNYQVVGAKGNLTVVLDLTDQVFNVSENLSLKQDLTIRNQNGAANFLYLLDVNATNIDPSCSPAGDISFELTNQTNVINNGTNFTMKPGFNDFDFTISAVNNRVCPQNISVTLDFSEQ
ncbi:hypothetical protein LCGC14_2767160, partial [marine sediment metagenome]